MSILTEPGLSQMLFIALLTLSKYRSMKCSQNVNCLSSYCPTTAVKCSWEINTSFLWKHPKYKKMNDFSWSTPSLNHPAPTDSIQIQIHQCIKLSCAPTALIWCYFLFLCTQNHNSPHRLSGKPHFFCLTFPYTSPICAQILSFFLSLEHVIFWLLVWSHCKYFQYGITVSKSLLSLPGEKQNSHLRFSCGTFLANITTVRPPTCAGEKKNWPCNLCFSSFFPSSFLL